MVPGASRPTRTLAMAPAAAAAATRIEFPNGCPHTLYGSGRCRGKYRSLRTRGAPTRRRPRASRTCVRCPGCYLLHFNTQHHDHPITIIASTRHDDRVYENPSRFETRYACFKTTVRVSILNERMSMQLHGVYSARQRLPARASSGIVAPDAVQAPGSNRAGAASAPPCSTRET